MNQPGYTSATRLKATEVRYLLLTKTTTKRDIKNGRPKAYKKNPQDHHWFGHLKPPLKAQVEGGKPFLNRCDDMIVIHRLVKHVDMKYQTMISVEKVKDRDTGGQQTDLNEPLLFDYNKGLGFKIGGVCPIKRETKENFSRLELNNLQGEGFDDCPF